MLLPPRPTIPLPQTTQLKSDTVLLFWEDVDGNKMPLRAPADFMEAKSHITVNQMSLKLLMTGASWGRDPV